MTRSMDAPEIVASALDRAQSLLRVLDREHVPAELYGNLRGVRHELLTAQEALRRAMPAAGPEASRDGVIGLEAPTWAARRALATRPDGHRHRALRLLVAAPLGLTDPELAEALGLSLKVAKQLRWEMASAAWVTATQQRRVNPTTGRTCRVWLSSSLGRHMLGKLESGQMELEIG